MPSVAETLEAALFVGREPLTGASFCRAFPGVTEDEFDAAIRGLRERYRSEDRPYQLRRHDEGFVLELKDPYRSELVERWMGQRQIKLSRPAIDVLSVVTYRQPIAKQAVDEIVGFDAGPALRQLTRRGLIQLADKGDDPSATAYATAPRFLEIFGLESMADIPTSDELDRPSY
jgi:segregation and condensation protein B